MSALTQDRNTPKRAGEVFSVPVGAGAVIYAGSLVALNGGYAEPFSSATGLVCAGRALEQIDNSGGADGDVFITVEAGVFKYANAGDIDLTDVGATGYGVDDQTVSSSDGTGTRSACSTIVGVESDGVWIRCGLGY